MNTHRIHAIQALKAASVVSIIASPNNTSPFNLQGCYQNEYVFAETHSIIVPQQGIRIGRNSCLVAFLLA